MRERAGRTHRNLTPAGSSLSMRHRLMLPSQPDRALYLRSLLNLLHLPAPAAVLTVGNTTRVTEHGVGSAILVLAEAGEFFGERWIARPQPDQTSLLDEQNDEDGEEAGSGDGTPAPVAEADREFGGEGPADEPAPKRQRCTARETVAA